MKRRDFIAEAVACGISRQSAQRLKAAIRGRSLEVVSGTATPRAVERAIREAVRQAVVS